MDKIFINGKEIELDFKQWQVVYLKLDPNGTQGMITGFNYRNGSVTWNVSWADFKDDERYAQELVEERESY